MAAQLVDNDSEIAIKSELDLFSVYPTQVCVDRSYWEDLNLSTSLNQMGPYEFRVPGSPHYLDMRSNYIWMKFKILDEDNVALPAANPLVGPINAIGKTFWRNMRLFIGGKLVEDANNLYCYRSFLETELNYGKDAKTTGHLGTIMYEEDTPYSDIDGEDNTGLLKRATPFRLSKVNEVMAMVHSDLFLQNKYLPSQLEMRLELSRNSDSFALMQGKVGTVKYKIHIESLVWRIRRVVVAPSTALGLEAALLTRPAKFPIRRVCLSTMHVDSNARATPTFSVISGQIPRKVCSDDLINVAVNVCKHTFSDFNRLCGNRRFPRLICTQPVQFQTLQRHGRLSHGCWSDGSTNSIQDEL
jgi:hypothetical protein